MSHNTIPTKDPLFPAIRREVTSAVTRANHSSPPPRRRRRWVAPGKAFAVAGLAIGAGAGGFAVAGGVNEGTGTPPPVEAPAPNPSRPDARQDLISALTLGGEEGVSGLSLPAERIAAMRDGFSPGIEPGEIPDDRVLVSDSDLQIVAFWGDRSVCLRIRPVSGGGSNICSRFETASDPATPMYTAPEKGESGPVVMLVPDSIVKVVVRSKDGLARVVPVKRNLAVGEVSNFSSLTWVADNGTAYRR